ncbi:MAG: hypothetical protein AAGA55_05025, partial [Planctomycetota bacterium]
MSAGVVGSGLTALVRGSVVSSEPVRKAVRRVNYSWITVLAALGLCVIGIYSIVVGETRGSSAIAPEAAKQAVFLVIGLIASVVIAAPHYRF